MEKRILTVKKYHSDGVCVLVENGVPCNKIVASRGLCTGHRSYLTARGDLEKYALPKESPKKRYLLNPVPIAGRCCVIENGFSCNAPATRGGSLCRHHYMSLWQREKLSGDLKVKDFVIPLTFSRRKKSVAEVCVVREETRDSQVRLCTRPAGYRGICEEHYAILERNPELLETIANPLLRRSSPKEDVCVVQEGIAEGEQRFCKERARARGLCRRHYKQLSKNPALFAKIANPIREKPEYRVRKEERQRQGRCVIMENDMICDAPAGGRRRVCDHHYHALKRVGLLTALTDPFLSAGKVPILRRKTEEAIVEGFCVMTVNGIPCTNTPKRRGLCDACIWAIGKTEGYEFEQFALPPQTIKVPEIGRKKKIFKGECIIIENGVPCDKTAGIRGLCRPHYKLATRQKKLAQIALSQEEIDRLPDIPHFYFDKNVVMNFAMLENFGTGQEASAALVDAVLRERLRATVSTDNIRALYSHLGHRLSLPLEEGGRNLEEREAEQAAREYVGKLFFGRGGLWRFVAFDAHQIEICTLGGRLPEFSLEDALELHLYARAKQERGPSLFVTSDGGILKYGEGVHPSEVMRTYVGLMDARYLTGVRLSFSPKN